MPSAPSSPPSCWRSTRRALWAEVALFAGIPVAAAAMARGYGM
ncbi:MAG: hypothetical protein ABSF67_02490 [Roseiarcus sp.]